MSKVLVYILDKAVWLLLVTVITGQALQITGFMETPKSAGAFEYQQNPLESLSEHPKDALRWKREADDTTERSQFIDMLFNIPIKTLTAVKNLIQNSRPALRKLRDFAVKRFEKTTKAPEADQSTVQKRSPVFIREVSNKQ
ncbi:uncharacterized protein LOC125505900 [Dendroctonus ponderosae]|uniref:Uncharacterized protein n=1 Tax=Dendroctonus ponderosae TaxID=77166 RepID=U4UFY3_DENPD|nr:uncharacterized protein LOC125505900 [Dendroctonus ponderosae]ERL91927.1 hypothetical protein D910_09250 [Dendroctonus ponderosae]KAH1019741.1 hypothetical protein HUJ04_009522 [Dendroctonus ponderosae]